MESREAAEECHYFISLHRCCLPHHLEASGSQARTYGLWESSLLLACGLSSCTLTVWSQESAETYGSPWPFNMPQIMPTCLSEFSKPGWTWRDEGIMKPMGDSLAWIPSEVLYFLLHTFQFAWTLAPINPAYVLVWWLKRRVIPL